MIEIKKIVMNNNLPLLPNAVKICDFTALKFL